MYVSYIITFLKAKFTNSSQVLDIYMGRNCQTQPSVKAKSSYTGLASAKINEIVRHNLICIKMTNIS